MRSMVKTYAILHNVRSRHNVGSIFRTADGSGVSKLYLTGYTPAPVDRFGRVDEKMAKVALGATETVPYEKHEDIHSVIEALKQEGIAIVAVEQTDSAIAYTEFTQTSDTAYIFGNEVAGLEQEVLDAAEMHVSIPMHGIKESLNVSVCAGIILFRR